jgi:TRAP-type C4-dicarboxylate transport system permease small subunit
MVRLGNTLNGIFDRIIGVMNYCAIMLLIFVTLSVLTEVFMRYFLRHPLLWVVDIGEYILLWITFLSAAWVLKREGHVRMDLVVSHLSPRAQTLLNIITSFMGVVICLALFRYSGESTWDHFSRGVFRQGMIAVPKAPIMAIIPLGSLLLAIQFLRRASDFLREWKKHARTGLKTNRKINMAQE